MKPAWAIPTVAFVLLLAPEGRAQEPGVFTGNLARRSARYAPDRVVVGFANRVTDAEAAQIVSGLRQGVFVRARGLRRAFHVLAVPKGARV